VKLPDKYLAVHNIGMLQRQAGVDARVGELVQAHARLAVDAGQAVSFDFEPFAKGTPEAALFRRLSAANPHANARFLRFLAAYGGGFKRRALPVIFDTDHLAKQLSLSPRMLLFINAMPAGFYRELRIPKKDGGERRLLSPREPLRQAQYWVLRRLLDRCSVHDAAHAFVRGRSIVTNARLHQGRAVVVRVDLENFFPSVRKTAIRKVFQRIGYVYSVADALAALCTVDGGLPQGASTSPALSNLAAINLDVRFTALGKRLDFHYSRYADDLIFSSNDERLPALLPFFREVIASEGYVVNQKKTRVMRQGVPQMVTGLVANVKPALPRARRRLLRAMTHRLRTRGAEALTLARDRRQGRELVPVLEGHLAFARMVQQQRGQVDS
jgi:RNA-directed DNA polymerase